MQVTADQLGIICIDVCKMKTPPEPVEDLLLRGYRKELKRNSNRHLFQRRENLNAAASADIRIPFVRVKA
jgi:hypothetical protein